MPPMTSATPQLHWTDADGAEQAVAWRSLAGHAPPARVEVVDDSLDAGRALRLASEGTGLLWCGDFHNARQLMQALARRLERQQQRPARAPAPATGPAALAQAFQARRLAQAERAAVLGRLILPFEADHSVPLRRAPDVRDAAREAFGALGPDEAYAASLRELQGAIGAFEWRKKGVPIAALRASIHPHHGVFSPVRGEYVDLVARAPLPAAAQRHGAFDIGTGTGVLAAVLARRGLQVTATDLDPRALACAADNLQRLKLAGRVTLLQADLFPPGRAGLVVCNPPWVPAQPSSPLEAAVYDPDSRMLRGWLSGLAAHLVEGDQGAEGWLILSDLAEHLGLRTRAELQGWIEAGGLRVLGRLDTRPVHKRAADASDPLHAARAAEVTSLWRLGAA
jgi:methylase of polypeptide subunit release factors